MGLQIYKNDNSMSQRDHYYAFINKHIKNYRYGMTITNKDIIKTIDNSASIVDGTNFTFHFDTSKYIELEIVCIFLRKICSHEWGISTYTSKYKAAFSLFESFLKDKYPYIQSITELDDSAIAQWEDFLRKTAIVKYSTNLTKIECFKADYKPFISFLQKTLGKINEGLTERDYWGDDLWDVRNFKEYNFSYVKSSSHYNVNFTSIKSKPLRELAKKYTKRKLLEYGNFVWGTAGAYAVTLGKFFNYIDARYPGIDTLKDITRNDILEYIDYIASLSNTKNPKNYLSNHLYVLSAFIMYIQLNDFAEAPEIPCMKLILKSDIPNRNNGYYGVNKYVPDYVLNQLFRFSNHLNYETRVVICIMYNTGLRISDTLELTFESLENVAGQYWLTSDIIKVKITEHRIPISDDLAMLIDGMIQDTKDAVPEKYNPNHYIFYSKYKFDGSPISQKKIVVNLNKLANDFNICSEDGNLYHFKNHPFRHSFAISCINGGMDLITLQDILGHASPEMTLAYAKLLDDTKKEIFREVLSTGVFSFSDNSLKEYDTSDIDPTELESFWMMYKLNAIDTPYGVCMQRTSGKCTYASMPPCLTCRGGEPCSDLCIGVNSTDIEKYRILLSSTQSMIEIAKKNGKEEMLKENEIIYQRYSLIYEKIKSGNIIYGRANRLQFDIKKGKSKHE